MRCCRNDALHCWEPLWTKLLSGNHDWDGYLAILGQCRIKFKKLLTAILTRLSDSEIDFLAVGFHYTASIANSEKTANSESPSSLVYSMRLVQIGAFFYLRTLPVDLNTDNAHDNNRPLLLRTTLCCSAAIKIRHSFGVNRYLGELSGSTVLSYSVFHFLQKLPSFCSLYIPLCCVDHLGLFAANFKEKVSLLL